jgi:putative acetyltransferase
VNLRPYGENDAREIAELFHDTVHSINRRDYTREQLAVWAPHEIDYEYWKRRLGEKKPIVAEIDEKIVGFAELDPDGHIDCFYVHKDYQRRKIGEQMLDRLIGSAKAMGIRRLYAEVTMTAVPFFEKNGFGMIRKNTVLREGVQLRNYVMEKHLDPWSIPRAHEYKETK